VNICESFVNILSPALNLAGQLRVPRKTYDGWCDGRTPASEAMVRRMMTLIDATA
jgi:hypothetical protein